ncbi:sulfurtransferase [Sphingomonas sabuli]|uniref:Sulfurtransferase n=1 Tax=Sphingomonas sabuli TaxID=2764186 RepID=A0A7G9L1I3_9SPHN|nr:sulfurtransferase [Sphingomonas sabuli]QNM82482.1 sulfurtransferase [Sphingomonas sabuli]
MKSLVSTAWLADHLDETDITVVDFTWFMGGSDRNGAREYLDAHIPGARFLDIDAVSDPDHPAPHMLPDADAFAKAAEAAGIDSADRIVVYDNSPLRTAARGWFMLRHFGARRVAVLDGGLGKWLAEGRPVESGEPPHRPARFEGDERQDVVTKRQLLAWSGVTLVDARGKARFEGSEADPRPGVAAGHIPGARNVPYASVYNEDGTLRSECELLHIFRDAGLDPLEAFVASCGSGVTASSLLFAAHLLGNNAAEMYDGSWSEWGADPATPKALGPA